MQTVNSKEEQHTVEQEKPASIKRAINIVSQGRNIYSALRDLYAKEFDRENPPEVEIDTYSEFQWSYNRENTKAFIDSFFAQAKESNKAPWLLEALKHDPAFMLDPVKDYYIHMIPESLRKQLSERELMEAIAIYDPVTWGELHLLQKHVDPLTGQAGWRSRLSRNGIPYQSFMIRCQSPRLVARAGRRTGKTASMVVKILHKAFTWIPPENQSYYNIVIFTPNQSQLNTIFKMIEIMIDGNPVLLQEIKKGGRIPTRKTPNIELEFKNGVTIKGFVSGSTAIRSSAAHYLVLDEASYLSTEDIEAVVALITENPNVELWVSSTPTGLRDWFYEQVHSPDFVSFHFPSDKFNPYWSEAMEKELRSMYTSAGYKHEFLAEFSADGQGVFQPVFIDQAIKDYSTAECKPRKDCYYGLGVDWNDIENGTKIHVVEFNPAEKRYRLVHYESIAVEGYTQTKAVEKIRQLNAVWMPSVIYCDYGHGSTAVELLHLLASQASPGSPDLNLRIAKAVDFGSKITIRDPLTMQEVEKPVKPYMVNNAVRVFEEGQIDIPKEHNLLKKQLEGYIIDHYTPRGIPVYKASSEYGDHDLDALMLALLGFNIEYSTLSKPVPVMEMGIVKYKGSSAQGDPELEALRRRAETYAQRLQADKEREAQEYINSHPEAHIAVMTSGTYKRRVNFGRNISQSSNIRRRTW
jgi:hypothetical protein